jgi:hypothetical protein
MIPTSAWVACYRFEHIRVRPCPDAERLDYFAAEQSREMITFGENREPDRRAEAPDDIRDRIGVTVERWNTSERGPSVSRRPHRRALQLVPRAQWRGMPKSPSVPPWGPRPPRF